MPEPAAKIEEFFSKYKTRTYPKGQIIIYSGDQPDYVYNVVSGKVKQYDVTYRGDEIILNIFKPPAFFPMAIVINKTPNLYIYEADSDVELRQAPINEVYEFVKANPDVTLDLLSRVYKGLDGLLQKMSYLMSSNAKSRLMYELIVEARRFGEHTKDGGCRINLSEKDLGARAGLSRETISREISKLKTEGIVSLKGRSIFINNMETLQNKIGKEI